MLVIGSPLIAMAAELRKRLRQVERREECITQQRRNGTSEEPAATAELLSLLCASSLSIHFLHNELQHSAAYMCVLDCTTRVGMAVALALGTRLMPEWKSVLQRMPGFPECAFERHRVRDRAACDRAMTRHLAVLMLHWMRRHRWATDGSLSV